MPQSKGGDPDPPTPSSLEVSLLRVTGNHSGLEPRRGVTDPSLIRLILSSGLPQWLRQ